MFQRPILLDNPLGYVPISLMRVPYGSQGLLRDSHTYNKKNVVIRQYHTLESTRDVKLDIERSRAKESLDQLIASKKLKQL